MGAGVHTLADTAVQPDAALASPPDAGTPRQLPFRRPLEEGAVTGLPPVSSPVAGAVRHGVALDDVAGPATWPPLAA